MAEKKTEQLIKKNYKRHTRYPQIGFDKLQMYFGYPYTIDLEGVEGKITIIQPTIGRIAEFGEKRFYQTLNTFVCNASSYKVMLWEAGVDWNTISDFDLFLMLYKTGIDSEVCKLIFEDLDFSTFEIYGKPNPDPEKEEQIPVLYSQELNIEIDEKVYQHIHQYLQNVFNIFPEEKYTKDSMLKEWWVNGEKREAETDRKKIEKGEKDADASSLQNVISACVNHPGFKYNLKELREIGVCQFYDSVKRLQVYESATACLKGMFSGFVSSKDLKPDEYNFMKEIN